MNTEETLAIYLNNGNRLLEEGNLEEAIAAYCHAIELNPDISWSYHYLGEALSQQGKLEEASSAYRRAIEINPEFSWSYHHLGDALERQQQWKRSSAAFRQAIELNPEHFGSYVGLGKSLEKLGQLDEAIAAYRRASELAPEADWIQYRLGEVLQQRTELDWEGAIASYHRALELNPDDVQAYRKLLEIQPDNFEVRLQLGKRLVKQEQWEGAIAAYRHITELNPDDVQAHYRLGELLIKQGDLEGAIDTLRHSLELSPNSDQSYYNLGEALAAQGKATEAGLCYYKAFKLNPNNMQANQKRPRIYDCFAFFNELDVLRIRIEELKDVVDKFILVEATKTHSGNPKPLYYQEFSHEFAEYQDKIIHYIVDDMPEVQNNDRWPLENYQRDCIGLALIELECQDEDIILVSDVDEIPRKEKIRDSINLLSDNDFVIFTHDLYYTYLDKFDSQWWCGTVACKYKDFKVRTATQVRRDDEGFWSQNWKAADIRKEGFKHPYIEKGGWHFTSFGGGAKTSRYKLQSYAHAEGDNSKETGIPLINFDVARPTNDEESLGKYYYDIRDVEGKDIPDYLKNNIRQYRHFFKPKLTQMVIAHADLHLELASGIYKQNFDIAVNLWCCAMQLNPQIGKKKSFLAELQPVDYFQISPQQLCNRSGKLIQNEKGYQLVSCPEPGQLPLVSFGPYISVPDGIYRVKIDVEMDTIEAKETNNHQIFGFQFDMISAPGNTVFWDEKVDICDAQTEFYLELSNAIQLEVRFFSTGQKFAINSIELALLYRLEPNQSINSAQNSGDKRDRNIKDYFSRTMQNNLENLLAEENHPSGEEISKPLEDSLESGKTLTEQGAFESAIAAYRRAIELNPDDVQAYRKLLQIQPDNLEVWLQLGKALVKQEQWEEAIDSYRNVIELNPEIIEEYQKLGELLVKQGELEEAIKCWRALSECNYNFYIQCFLNDLEPINTIPINPEKLVVNQITVGEIIQGSSGFQLLCQSGKQGLVSYGPYLNIPDGLYRVRIDCEFPELTTDDKSLGKVGFKFDIISDGGTCSWYATEVKIEQEKIEFFIDLVEADLMEIRFFATGNAFCINLIEFNLVYKPTPSYYWDIGRFLQAQGKIKKAATAYKKSHFNLSNNYNFYSSLGEHLIKQGYSEEASAVYYEWGEKSIENSKILEAITAYNLFLQLKPNWQEIGEKLAKLQEQLEQISTEIETCKNHLKSNPTCPETWFKLGELYENISNELAIQSYQKTLDIDISWPEAYVRIRKIRREMGSFQRDVSREPVTDSELILSVVIQTYNRATRLQKSLESYVKTDRSDIEFLICDNNSTDNTEELVQSFMAVDKRIRYIRHYTNLGASCNGFIGFVSAKAPLVMFITDDDYMTEGFVDAVIFIFDNYPTVGAVLNHPQSPHRLAAYSKNLRGGELHKKGKETVLSAALLSSQLCGSTYRRETVNYRLWNVNDSIIAAVWLSSDLAMRYDIYVLFLKTEYPIINAYITIPTEDGQIGASSMLYRTKNGFLNWNGGAAERVDFPLYLINRLGLSNPEDWQFYHDSVAGLFQAWLWAHFRLWYPEDVEGAFVFLSRVLRHPYIRFSLLFWQIMIRESLSPSVKVTVQDRITIIMLGCFMLIWRLIIYLRDLIDPGLADIYYTGVWPRKDTIQLTHSQAELEIESSRDIGYSALTVVHDLQYELDNM